MKIKLKQDLCTGSCSVGVENCDLPTYFRKNMEYEARVFESKPSSGWCSCLGGTPSDEGHQLVKEPGYIIEIENIGNYWIPGKFAEEKETPIAKVAKSIKRISKEEFLDKMGDMM